MKDKPQDVKYRTEPLSFSEELARAVIDSLSAHIAIIDENGVILECNRAWKVFSVKNGMPEMPEPITAIRIDFIPLQIRSITICCGKYRADYNLLELSMTLNTKEFILSSIFQVGLKAEPHVCVLL